MPSTREKKTDLHEKTIFFSNRSHCRKITSGGYFVADELFSDHEADTKLVALAHAADVAPGEAVMVIILVIILVIDIRVLVDSGIGKSRKGKIAFWKAMLKRVH